METIERTDIRWHIGLAIGALCVSASAVLLGLADTTPATATVARSALALPVVAALAFFERRHNARFYGFMDQFLPAWRESRSELNRSPD